VVVGCFFWGLLFSRSLPGSFVRSIPSTIVKILTPTSLYVPLPCDDGCLGYSVPLSLHFPPRRYLPISRSASIFWYTAGTFYLPLQLLLSRHVSPPPPLHRLRRLSCCSSKHAIAFRFLGAPNEYTPALLVLPPFRRLLYIVAGQHHTSFTYIGGEPKQFPSPPLDPLFLS